MLICIAPGLIDNKARSPEAIAYSSERGAEFLERLSNVNEADPSASAGFAFGKLASGRIDDRRMKHLGSPTSALNILPGLAACRNDLELSALILMAKFYFDISDGCSVDIDDIGSEFEELRGAKEEAMRTIASLGYDALRDKAEERFALTIRDETGPALEIVAEFRIRPLRDTPL